MDHNHTTGEFRGVLCNGCNRALGLFKDNEEVVKTALEYLRENGWKPAREKSKK